MVDSTEYRILLDTEEYSYLVLIFDWLNFPSTVIRHSSARRYYIEILVGFIYTVTFTTRTKQ
jgi:hypothetical protein